MKTPEARLIAVPILIVISFVAGSIINASPFELFVVGMLVLIWNKP